MNTKKIIKKINHIGDLKDLNTNNKNSIIEAINEIGSRTNEGSYGNAGSITFNNSSNQMTATNVQDAIEENKTSILSQSVEIMGLKEELNGVKTKAINIASQMIEV